MLRVGRRVIPWVPPNTKDIVWTVAWNRRARYAPRADIEQVVARVLRKLDADPPLDEVEFLDKVEAAFKETEQLLCNAED
jgi:hypothetical protein